MKNAIKMIEAIYNKQSTNSVEHSVKLSVNNGKLKIIYWGKENSFVSRELKTTLSDGIHVVALSQLFKFAKNNETLNINQEAGQLFAFSKNRRFRLAEGVSVEDIPQLKEFDSDFTVTIRKDIKQSIKQCSKITAINNYLNPACAGVLFDGDNLVATDIHRLILKQDYIKTPKPFVINRELQKVLMSLDLSEIQSFKVSKDDVSILKTKYGAFFCENIKNEFPDYNSAIGGRDKQQNISKNFNKKKLIKELKTFISMLKEPRSKVVGCKYKDSAFSGVDSEGSRYEFNFDLGFEQSFGLNAIFLKEALELIEGEALIALKNESMTPVEIFNNNTRHIVMPMRID